MLSSLGRYFYKEGTSRGQMTKAPADLRSLARSHTELSIQTLAGIARNSTSDQGESPAQPVAASFANAVVFSAQRKHLYRPEGNICPDPSRSKSESFLIVSVAHW